MMGPPTPPLNSPTAALIRFTVSFVGFILVYVIVTFLVFQRVLPTWAVVLYSAAGIAGIVLVARGAAGDTPSAAWAVALGGAAVSIIAAAGAVLAAVIGITGSPPRSPDCVAVDSIKANLQRGVIPTLSEADLQCLRQAFQTDIAAQTRIASDTARDAHDANHAASHRQAFLSVYHHEDSTQLIPGPAGEIRPIRGARLNTPRTLSRGQWVTWMDMGPLGLPGRNIPPGINYGLLLYIARPANTQQLLDALRTHKESNINRVWAALHEAIPHVHDSTIVPVAGDEEPREPDAPTYRRGHLIKLYVPEQGSDYRFVGVGYSRVPINVRDQALWLEHSESGACHACDPNGWCGDDEIW